MAQGGMNGDPAIQKVWGRNNFNDDPVKQSNKRGFVTFAKTGAPNSRSTQIFINYGDNCDLDPQGFAPFGQVDRRHGSGRQVRQLRHGTTFRTRARITNEGNAYLKQAIIRSSTVIKKATIEK